MRRIINVTLFLFMLSLPIQAQSFSSGSTGADGALDLTSGNRTLQVPNSGIFNFTTVNIPSGRTLTFQRNLQNTPVIILAQGNVTIEGTINVSAIAGSRTPGPGGFHGGAFNQPGFGPGGGQPSPGNQAGRWVGPLSLVPIIGGSGGCCNGFGGGGAIVIASSTSISIAGSGAILADAPVFFGCGSISNTGAGGAIRLVANSITSNGILSASDNCRGINHGVIRLEAPVGALTAGGGISPPPVLSTINPIIAPSAIPSLTIVSIAGFPVPAGAGQRFDAADVLLPNQLPDPLSVVVQASNIPLGTQVSVTFSGSQGATSTPGTLSGTLGNSTATPTISGLNRAVGVVTYLFVSATFDLQSSLKPNAANYNPKGPDQVAKVRIEAAPGAKPKYIFLRSDGTVIDVRKVPQQVLQQFGQ